MCMCNKNPMFQVPHMLGVRHPTRRRRRRKSIGVVNVIFGIGHHIAVYFLNLTPQLKTAV